MGAQYTGASVETSTSYLRGVGKISAPYTKVTETLDEMQKLPSIAGTIRGMAKPEPSPVEEKIMQNITWVNFHFLNRTL